MATQKQLREHFLNLGKQGAIYVWGANCQIITKDLMNRLCKAVSSKKYNKAYYDGKLEEGEGKPGADCSGAIEPVSGYDTTAQGYYNRCVEKGNIQDIPQKVCLVFRRNASKEITHVGCYTGDGYVSEMASSKKNYQRKKLNKAEWDYWGMPDFISDPETVWTISTTTSKKEGSKYMLETVKRGRKSDSVGIAQSILKAMGYKGKDGEELEVDCSCGANTEYAINCYQEDRRAEGVELGTNGKNDGSCGPKMWMDMVSRLEVK